MEDCHTIIVEIPKSWCAEVAKAVCKEQSMILKDKPDHEFIIMQITNEFKGRLKNMYTKQYRNRKIEVMPELPEIKVYLKEEV